MKHVNNGIKIGQMSLTTKNNKGIFHMNFKNIPQIIGIALVCMISTNAFAFPFIFKNDSQYDIFYRCRSNAEAAANQNFNCNNGIVKAGDSVELDTKRNYSIKVAGTSPLMKYSSFYDVPHPYTLARNTLSREDKGTFDEALYKGQCTAVITVQAGVVYGWSFRISYTCMK